MHLYAVRRIEDVTVADIADEADMTSAAVYYHYPSKEDLLLAGLREFAEGLVNEVEQLLKTAPDRSASVGSVVYDVVEWLETRRAPAIVWFINSPGLSESVEALRRETRLQMIEAFSALFVKAPAAMSRPDAGVTALALVVLLEQAAVSSLTEDVVLANLGHRRFSLEVIALGDLIAAGG